MSYRKMALAAFLTLSTTLSFGGESEQSGSVADRCLDWKVDSIPSDSDASSCSFYNPEKTSTRFLVRNHCSSEVSGVFTYYKTDAGQRPILSMHPFAVKPGQVVEVANPCSMSSPESIQVSQVSMNSAV
ncbi:hypothetical protein IB286_04300 [Spongiibacter sp. KMU-158]|uniref:Secreted protein n=1 Tax=Spongiibacter pelagi TaxID=2760804 RepID=A0A927C2D1_9GAMM|nr:hypothetical protein [Spongiibacter pelagi]MBD2858220.1 hypothetical protein [Spongiibacter pelagi]